jgi:hypothetical protein
VSESVEQAALRRATDEDLAGRARREAAAIYDGDGSYPPHSRADLIRMLAIAWLQGSIYGSHATLANAEVAFENLRAAL